MKKNITINLFGTLYAIDEDAYQLLSRYLGETRAYFLRREGGEEIADDIEHRVAELLAELRQRGIEAISIEHITAIIDRIGNPEEMSDAPAAPQETPRDTGRRLMRDPEDKLLGGLVAGLCHYFGLTHIAAARGLLAFAYLMVLFADDLDHLVCLAPVVAYALLCYFVPAAHTAEDRLRMTGREVTPNALQEEIMMMTAREQQPAPRAASRLTSVLARTLLVLFVVIPLAGTLIWLVVNLSALVYVALCGSNWTLASGLCYDDTVARAAVHAPYFMGQIVCANVGWAVACGLALWFACTLLRLRRPAHPRRLALTFLLAVVFSLAMTVIAGLNISHSKELHPIEYEWEPYVVDE